MPPPTLFRVKRCFRGRTRNTVPNYYLKSLNYTRHILYVGNHGRLWTTSGWSTKIGMFHLNQFLLHGSWLMLDCPVPVMHQPSLPPFWQITPSSFQNPWNEFMWQFEHSLQNTALNNFDSKLYYLQNTALNYFDSKLTKEGWLVTFWFKMLHFGLDQSPTRFGMPIFLRRFFVCFVFCPTITVWLC